MEKSAKRKHKWKIKRDNEDECIICGCLRINVWSNNWKIYNYVIKETGEIRTKLQCLEQQYKLKL